MSDIKKYDTIYYGAARSGRLEYFKKYLFSGMYISTSKKNIKKFIELIEEDVKLKFIEPINFLKSSPLRFFRYTIYMEDKASHNNYCNPANRFYECLSFKVVQFFDEKCLNTFNHYGIDIDDFVVSNRKELINKINKTKYRKAWKKQSIWIKKALQDQKQLRKDLDNFFKKEINI